MTDDQTVYDRFARVAARWPGRAFFNVLPETADIYGIDAGAWTYGAALSVVDRLADAYANNGYGPGHRVGLLLENRPDFLWHWLALNRVGAGIVPINPDLRRGELTYLIEHSEMAAAIAIPGRASDLNAAEPGLKVVAPDEVPPAVTGAGPRTDDPECALLYTSGTTGRPKGCVLTNRYFLRCGDWYAGVGGHLNIAEDPQERMLTPLPLFHMNALACSVMGMMTVGGCLSVLDRFHPRTWWNSVRAAEATCIHYLGIMPPLFMAEAPGPADRDHSVRFGFGAGIDPAIHAACEERFGFPFVEGWAMTETGSGGVIMATHDPRPVGQGSFGRPRGGVEARIVTDDGREAGTDEPGEMLVRRAGDDPRWGFFREYLKNPEATAEAWQDGWLHTGDVVLKTADGDFRFVDRKKNVIRRSGENISAAEIESLLGRHPAIDAIACTPVPDQMRGEEVCALVVSDRRNRKAAEALVRWSLAEMAYFKAPGWLAFVDDIPKTATNKLQRGEIKTIGARLVAEGSAFDCRALKKRTA